MTESAPVELIPEDLHNKLKSLQAIANTFKLLERGMFTYDAHGDVVQCLKFLQALHDQLIKDASTHPQAHLVPGLLNNTEEQVNG